MIAEAFDAYHKWLGIPPEHQPPNHYRLLGLCPYEDDVEVIDRAADQPMAYLRRFQSGFHAGESEQLLNEVSAARLCLRNSSKRKRYNNILSPECEAPPIQTPIEETSVYKIVIENHQSVYSFSSWILPTTISLLSLLALAAISIVLMVVV